MIKTSSSTAWLLSLIAIALIIGLPACGETPPVTDDPSQTPIPMTPFLTASATIPSSAPENPVQNDQTVPENINPTATPVLYTIQSGDTLSVVAFRLNVSLEDLLAANPGVDPNLLIIGTELIIPTGEGQILGLPTPTPVAVDLGEPTCYATSDGGEWCFVMATNQQAQAVENISIMLRVFEPEGNMVAQQIAVSPLNVLPQGESIVLAAFFPSSFQRDEYVKAELLTSIPLADENQRYIDPSIDVENVELGETVAVVGGEVSIPNGANAQPANLIWLVAIAYDEFGLPVGLRKFQHTGEIQPGGSIDFNFRVFSNGPNIADITIQGEAHP